MPARTYTRLVAIVGRPNVGKSTLFNRIIRERKSLVHDEPGVTRDRIFGRAQFNGQNFYLCDTGGFEPTSQDNIKMQLVEQAELAIEEADSVIFVVDGREGLHPVDADLIRRLRRADKKFVVACNKCDLPKDDFLAEDFRKLGVDRIFPVSAEHNRGVGDLLEEAVSVLNELPQVRLESEGVIRLALIGRPNVGKSSLLNRIAGEVRSIVDPRPGTTRDTVDVSIRAFENEFVILDTAGIRRKSRMVDNLEKFSALRSVTCLEECDVAVLVIDASEGPTEGDARVAGYAFEMRKPILIVVNKWDLLENKTSKSTKTFTEFLHEALRYIRYAPILFTSAEENQRVSRILPTCLDLYNQARKRLTTGEVNRALKDILVKHTPPLSKGRARRIKFFYATQVGSLPPRFVIFC
ncbi:MAG: ribosome biogenesis GTPase Der, partial [Silvanigrellales bacterium]|nr:ribosome biogenesis GTPase Der [Silvanigrellales bacterium]